VLLGSGSVLAGTTNRIHQIDRLPQLGSPIDTESGVRPDGRVGERAQPAETVTFFR
jgi:hypothetical protein